MITVKGVGTVTTVLFDVIRCVGLRGPFKYYVIVNGPQLNFVTVVFDLP